MSEIIAAIPSITTISRFFLLLGVNVPESFTLPNGNSQYTPSCVHESSIRCRIAPKRTPAQNIRRNESIAAVTSAAMNTARSRSEISRRYIVRITAAKTVPKSEWSSPRCLGFMRPSETMNTSADIG